MNKFTLGEVIDGLLSGKFKKATAKTGDDWLTELELNEKDQLRIYKRETLGDNVLYKPFTPDHDDNILEWEVEYHIDHQPLDFLVVQYWKNHGAVSTKETATFSEQSWSESRSSLVFQHDFKKSISIVGFLDNRVIVFLGEVEQA